MLRRQGSSLSCSPPHGGTEENGSRWLRGCRTRMRYGLVSNLQFPFRPGLAANQKNLPVPQNKTLAFLRLKCRRDLPSLDILVQLMHVISHRPVESQCSQHTKYVEEMAHVVSKRMSIKTKHPILVSLPPPAV